MVRRAGRLFFSGARRFFPGDPWRNVQPRIRAAAQPMAQAIERPHVVAIERLGNRDVKIVRDRCEAEDNPVGRSLAYMRAKSPRA